MSASAYNDGLSAWIRVPRKQAATVGDTNYNYNNNKNNYDDDNNSNQTTAFNNSAKLMSILPKISSKWEWRRWRRDGGVPVSPPPKHSEHVAERRCRCGRAKWTRSHASYSQRISIQMFSGDDGDGRRAKDDERRATADGGRPLMAPDLRRV